VIRITVPALTEERRKELVKEAKKEAENAKDAIRNVRRDSNEDLKKQEKNGDISEDDLRTQTDKVQEVTDDFIKQIDDSTTEKEKDILEIYRYGLYHIRLSYSFFIYIHRMLLFVIIYITISLIQIHINSR